MAIKWNFLPMEWRKEGIEPSQNLKENGMPVGYKPPADVLNYFFHSSYKSINELQETVDALNTEQQEAVENIRKDVENISFDFGTF